MTSPTVWITALNRRFIAYRSFAIGIAMCGAGVAAGFAPPTMRFLIDTFDWREAYRLMAVFWCGTALLMTLIFFVEDRTTAGTVSTAARAEKRPGYLRKLFLSGNFVKIGLAIFLLMGSVSAFMLHLSPALVDNGFSRETAATLAGGGGIGGLAGKLGIGWLFDRLRLNVVTLGMTTVLAAACILMAPRTHDVRAALAACLIMGAAGGAVLTISACLTARFFPVEDFGLVYGGLGSVMALCTAIGPVSASIIHDQTGSYTLSSASRLP